MLQPIVGLLAGRIIANDIGGPQLAEMNTNSRNLAPDQFGQLTGGQWPPGLQVQHELIHNGISEQPTQTRFPITLFFHRGRSTTTSALLSNTLRRFDNSQNVKMRDTRDLPRFYHSFRNTLPCFRNAENVEMTAQPSSVPRCSLLHQKADLSFLRLWRCHELPDRIEDYFKLRIVFLLKGFKLASQVPVSCDHFP